MRVLGELMDRLVSSVTLYLNAQIAAGAQAVQLFDSWVGTLGPPDYRRYVLPYVSQIIAGLTPGVPVIHFAAGNPALLPLVAEAGSRVIGVDWRIDLEVAWQQLGYDRAVQGNLDPAVLLAEPAEIRRRAEADFGERGGPPRAHLQPRPRHPAEHAGRKRAGSDRRGPLLARAG